MSAAREIIARELLFVFLEKATDKADAILAALEAAGCRILGPDETDPLQKAVADYLSEHDNPAPDYAHRHHLRECMRKAAALRAAGGRNG